MAENTDPQPSRREAIIAALLAAPVVGASWVVPAVARSPQKNVPKILGERPMITGVLGKEFFQVGARPEFQEVFPYPNHVFLDGKDVWEDCFEVDLRGQWVGLIVRDVDGSFLIGDDRHIVRQWVRGVVEVKRKLT